MLENLSVLDKYQGLTENEMLDNNGGLVILGVTITTAVVLKGAGAFATGLSIGGALARVFR